MEMSETRKWTSWSRKYGYEKTKINESETEMVAKLSEILKNDWKKLATKFGYTSEEEEWLPVSSGRTAQYLMTSLSQSQE